MPWRRGRHPLCRWTSTKRRPGRVCRESTEHCGRRPVVVGHCYQAKIHLTAEPFADIGKDSLHTCYTHPRALTAVELEHYISREVEYLRERLAYVEKKLQQLWQTAGLTDPQGALFARAWSSALRIASSQRCGSVECSQPRIRGQCSAWSAHGELPSAPYEHGRSCRSGVFERIRLIKTIGPPLAIGHASTSGLDDRHPRADIPLVARIVCEHPFVASCRHQPAFIGDRALWREVETPLEPFQQPFPVSLRLTQNVLAAMCGRMRHGSEHRSAKRPGRECR